MKDLFGVAKVLKNGGESKIKELPPVSQLQLRPEHRDRYRLCVRCDVCVVVVCVCDMCVMCVLW